MENAVGVSRLYDLQQVDSALARAMAHRQGLDEGLAQRATVAAASDLLATVRDQMASDQSRLRALDLDIQSLQAKRKKVEADMYSGRIGNPKELAAMQEEVFAFDRVKTQHEDEVLTLLEQADVLESQARDAQQRLEVAAAELERRSGAFREAAAATDREISDLTVRRDELAAGVDEDLIRRYDRLRERKGGVAVVAVLSGICGGCHVAIPQRLVVRLEKDPDLLAACDGCGRLLVVRPRG